MCMALDRLRTGKGPPIWAIAMPRRPNWRQFPTAAPPHKRRVGASALLLTDWGPVKGHCQTEAVGYKLANGRENQIDARVCMGLQILITVSTAGRRPKEPGLAEGPLHAEAVQPARQAESLVSLAMYREAEKE